LLTGAVTITQTGLPLVLLGVPLLFFSCSKPFDSQVPPGLSGKIYFNSNRTGDSEIFVMNIDGSGLTNLSKSPDTDDEMPAVSPDGRKIVFMRGHFNDFDSFELWIMNSDGSEQIQLTHNDKADGHPDWSPDGSKIVFVSWRDGNDEIYIMNADGSNPRRLTDNPASDNDPDWSPDGRWIVFKSNRAYASGPPQETTGLDSSFEIFLMDTTGSHLTRLTFDGYSDHDPDWSPDGSTIAFLRYREGKGPDVWFMNPDGSAQRNFTKSGNSWYTSWSPDGNWLTFCSTRSDNTDIWLTSLDGEGPFQLTFSFFTDEYPAWR